MKKFYLLILVLITTNLFSQTFEVPESKKALLFKGTANWCGPCGYYHGVTDEIYTNYSESILFLNGHVASSSVGDPHSGDMHNLLNGAGGIPSYSVNGVHLDVWPPTVEMITDEANNFFGTSVVANVAFQYEINDNELTLNTTTKFFQDANADYFYVGAMVIENNILVNQKVDNDFEDQTQHRIQRTVIGTLIDDMPTGKLWADEIASGNVIAGSSFDHSFTKTLSSSWDYNELEVIVVVWQRTGDSFVALSSEDVEGALATSLDKVTNEKTVNIYPNPSKGIINISLNNHESDISIYNQLGVKKSFIVFEKKDLRIDISDYEPGIYYLKIKNKEESVVSTFLVE